MSGNTLQSTAVDFNNPGERLGEKALGKNVHLHENTQVVRFTVRQIGLHCQRGITHSSGTEWKLERDLRALHNRGHTLQCHSNRLICIGLDRVKFLRAVVICLFK